MADPLRVKLPQLHPAAYLESSGGTVVTLGGQSRLDGAFAIVVAGNKSDSLMFNGTTALAVVVLVSSDWVLQSVAKTIFGFSKPIFISDGQGPWLRAARCWLIQPARVGAMAMLSLDDARASMMSSSGDPGPGFVMFPTQNGDVAGPLSPLPHPENSSYEGFFVLPFESGHAVQLGTPLQAFSIDHAITTDILVNDDCSVLFPVSASASGTSLLLDSSSANSGAVARASVDSNLMMASSPQDGQWSRVRLPTNRIEVKAGWLKVTQFRDSELWLGETTDPAQPFNVSHSLFTPTNRLSYELQLTLKVPAARLIYSDPTTADVGADPGTRFYGLRISGLGSRTGVRPALDANQLAFDLSTAAHRQFHIKAGFANGSWLGPKRDPQNPSSRSLEIPVSSQLGLRAVATGASPSSSMQLDTEYGQFVVISPRLLSAPAGMSAKNPDVSDSAYSRWALVSDQLQVAFTLQNGMLKPGLGDKWLNQFHTADPSIQYGLIEHPGTKLVIDGLKSSPLAMRSAISSTERTEVTTVKTPDNKEIVAYSAFFAALSWAAAKCISGNCLDESQFQVKFPNLDDATFNKFVKQNGLQDLQVVYFGTDPDSSKQIRRFVDDNMAILGGPKPEKFLWAFAAGLSVLLFDQKNPNGPYCDSIAASRGRTNTCVAFDFSTSRSLNPVDLGYKDFTDFTPLAKQSPALWPRGFGDGTGARLDPSSPLWRGVFLRDLPLFLPTPPIVGTDFKFLQNLIDGINKRLVLDYGWRDESGATWFSSLDQSFDDGIFSPDSWKSVFQISLRSIRLKGAAGSIVTAEATCDILLNWVKNKTTQEPLKFSATFGLDLVSGGNPITRIDITKDGKDAIATDSIPGFDSIALKRFATDFKTAQFELLLTATDNLASALPFLSAHVPQLAILSFNLTGDPSFTLSLALPKEVETNLFGRWPLTVQAISIQLSEKDATVEVRIRGRLHLGIPAFSSVGATIVIRREPGKAPQLGVEIDSISGSLTVGSLQISGTFEWKDKDNHSGLVDLTGASTAGQARDLWGGLTVSDPGVLGTNMLAFRVGNQGEVSFWIGTIAIGPDIPLGIGRLKNPALLLAHNADFQGNLSKVVTDPTGSLLQVLRPDVSKEKRIEEWLAKWGPSSTIGTIVAGSGYVHLASGVAEAPVKDNTVDPNQLSSLLFSDRGLLRVDGVLAMLATVTMRFGLAIDYPNKRITAGLQAPSFKLPDPSNPEYEIQAGYITIGLGFSGGDPFLRVGIGWPERVGGSEFERDWSKATKIYARSMFPINTFWGGYLAELQKDSILFGFAIRAGWTWNYSVGGGIVKGSAELGITLGGVFQFRISWDKTATRGGPTMLPVFRENGLASSTLELTRKGVDGYNLTYDEKAAVALDSYDASVASLLSIDVAMSAEIFGDIWGKASVEFLGVTLVAISVRAYARFVVCGTFSRGITKAKAQVGFDVSVTILCVTFHAAAQVDITLRDGDCPLLDSANQLFLMGDVPERFAATPQNVFMLPRGE